MSINPVFAQISVTNDLFIDAACGISLGSNMDFGTVSVDVVSAEQPLRISADGNVPSDLTMYATDWAKSTDPSVEIIAGEFTRFAFTSGADYESDTETRSVNSTNGAITMDQNLINGDFIDSYWQVKPVLTPTSFTGAVQQTLSILAVC